MEWRRYHSLLSMMVRENKPGTESLYRKIPLFLRKKLHEFVDKTPWSKLCEACENKEPNSYDEANAMYKKMLNLMDKYIEFEYNQTGQLGNQASENSEYMADSKQAVLHWFENDGVEFVKEMASMLKTEGELIYVFSSEEVEEMPYMTEHDNSEKRKEYIPLMAAADKDIEDVKKLLGKMAGGGAGDIFVGSSLPEELRNISDSDIRDITSADLEAIQQTAGTDPSQQAVQLLTEIVEKLTTVMSSLECEMRDWRANEAQASVKTGRHRDLEPLKEDFSQFASLLSSMAKTLFDDKFSRLCQGVTTGPLSPGLLGSFIKQVKDIEDRFFKCNLVVSVQPKDMVSIEKDVRTVVKETKKKEFPYRSKKRQDLNTTLIILGAHCFPDLRIRSTKVELVADKDLSEEANCAQQENVVKQCGKVDGMSKVEDDYVSHAIVQWPDLEIKDFARFDSNMVYRQFFRFRYSILLEVHQEEFTVKTLSLPFTFNTGANQQLEHIGSRMWYCSNVDMYDGDFQCPDHLPVEQVMGMLNKRIMCVTDKQRPLSDGDMAFLRTRLPVGKDNYVSIQGFIKDKMPALIEGEDQPPFYTWYHGVMNSLTHTLSKPWEKMIIYGFCHVEEAKSMLMVPEVPEGTILFRPSASKVENPSSKDANTVLVMEVKLRTGSAEAKDGFEVMSIPLYINFIKDNGLYRAVKGIKKDKQSIAKYLYGANGTNRKVVDVLVEFGNGDMKPYIYDGYKVAIVKMESLSLQSLDPTKVKEEKKEPRSEGGEPRKKHRKRKQTTESRDSGQVAQSSATCVVKQESVESTTSHTSQMSHSSTASMSAADEHWPRSQTFAGLNGVVVDVSNLPTPSHTVEVGNEGENSQELSPLTSSGFGSAINSPETPGDHASSPPRLFHLPPKQVVVPSPSPQHGISSPEKQFSLEDLNPQFSETGLSQQMICDNFPSSQMFHTVPEGRMQFQSNRGFESTVIPYPYPHGHATQPPQPPGPQTSPGVVGNIPNILPEAKEQSKPAKRNNGRGNGGKRAVDYRTGNPFDSGQNFSTFATTSTFNSVSVQQTPATVNSSTLLHQSNANMAFQQFQQPAFGNSNQTLTNGDLQLQHQQQPLWSDHENNNNFILDPVLLCNDQPMTPISQHQSPMVISSSTSQQLTAMSPQQLALILSSATDQQMNAVSPQQSTTMSPQQMSAMSPRQMSAISPQQSTMMSPQQMSAISPQQMSAISPQHSTTMSPEQEFEERNEELEQQLVDAFLSSASSLEILNYEPSQRNVVVELVEQPASVMGGLGLFTGTSLSMEPEVHLGD